jgi:diaminopimelate epimerase
MHLRKYHGLGNDFLVLLDFDGKQPVDGELARAVCDRHTGVGADGLIRLTGTGDLRMELYNADGGRAETSGNGLRCVALAAADAGWDVGRSFTIATDAGPRRVDLHDDGLVSVEMGTARIDGRRVDMGNPHRVVLMDTDDIVEPDHRHENVELVWPGPGRDELRMRVFERGVGETMACGSGACAAAAVARAEGLVGQRVTVRQPGGNVTVQLGDPIVLTGPAAYICDVEYPWP